MFRLFTHAMDLYVIEQYQDLFPELSASRLTDGLILHCLEKHGIHGAAVRRTKKGKPFIVFAPDRGVEGKEVPQDVFVSASHSGDVFVCLITDVPAGVDIQKERTARFRQISSRYFTEEERAYVEQRGADGFFLLWTRKEAYSKYVGTGLEEIMKGTDVLRRQDVDFIDFLLRHDMKGACCIRKGAGKNLNIRKL